MLITVLCFEKSIYNVYSFQDIKRKGKENMKEEKTVVKFCVNGNWLTLGEFVSLAKDCEKPFIIQEVKTENDSVTFGIVALDTELKLKTLVQ